MGKMVGGTWFKDCGCNIVVGGGNEWVRCDECKLKAEEERKLEERYGKPTCPECGMDARRQKCAFELSPCPRFEVSMRWNEMLKEAVEAKKRRSYEQR